MAVEHGAQNATGRIENVRATRAAARKNAAEVGAALAAHYTPPETAPVRRGPAAPPAPRRGGGLPRVRNPFAPGIPLAPFSTPAGEPIHVRPIHVRPRLDTSALAAENRYEGLPAMDNPRTFGTAQDRADARRAVARIGETAHETLLQSGAYAAGLLHHGTVDPRAALRIHYRDGKVSFSGTHQQRVEAAGLLNLSGTGNALQKAGEDLFGIPVGLTDVALNPKQGGENFVKGLAKYYSTNPAENLRQDPFMFGLSYVLPAVSMGGSALGRAGALADTAGSFAPDASLADVARLRERGALQHMLEHGEPPTASALTKAKLLARAAVRTPPAPERGFDIGGQHVTLPASRNHAVNLFHRAVTDRIISHALDSGIDIFGGRSKVGRAIRSNLRVQGAIRNADLTRLAKATKGLSAPQEHAAWILAKGHTVDSYARYAGNALEGARLAGDEGAAAALEHQHELTKISAQYLEPGAEDPKVLRAADVMREVITKREGFYGRSEDQVNHAVGSHFYGIHTRAEGLPDLHEELGQIHEAHGPYAESPRQYLDQHISNLQRFAAQSGPEHAAELHAEISHLQTLENDVQFTQHRIHQVDQRIEELGSQHYRGRMTEHPDRLAATHRELMLERARLADHLTTLEAHARAREIHHAFTEKGAELRGHVMDNPARQQLIAVAHEHGIDATDAVRELDARALRWARETGRTTRDFYNEYLAGVKRGGEAPDSALYEIRQFHDFPAEDTGARLRARMNPRLAASGLPANAPLEQAGQHVLGPITPEAWLSRVESVIPTAAERDTFARWYEAFEPLFRKAFGDQADAHMRGFAVSQANASPSSGLQAVLRVADKVRQGIPVKADEISTVGQSIEAAFKGDPVSRGVAAKLSDFIDSLRGSDTRTYMGHAPEGGAPAAIDVHALRDLGYVDPKLVARLEARGLVNGRDFEVDNRGVAAGSRYEQGVRKYAQIADYLNEVGFDGRHDWTPAQTQALGWSAIQRFHGVEPENLQDAIDRNTYELPYEVGNGINGARPLPAKYSDAMRVTKGEEPVIRSIAQQHGATIRSIHYGPGGYEGDINPAGVVRVIASPEQATRIAQDMANHFQQWEVWATRSGITGSRSRAAIELGHESFRSKAAVEKFWKAFREALPAKLKDKAVGFTPFKYDDKTWGIRIITEHQPFVSTDAGRFLDRYHSTLETAADNAGIEGLRVRANNIEVRKAYGEDHQGADAEAGAGAGLGDHPAAEAEGEALHQQVGGEVRGAYDPATREVSIGEHADVSTFAHESLHAIRPSLDHAQLSSLERHYGVVDGQWTRAHEERFVEDMTRAARGEKVDPVVQSVFNASLVAPPEAFYLPFERNTKPTRGGAGATGRRASTFGFGPPSQEAIHEFTGQILDSGDFRTRASHLATHAYAKAAHWQNMQDLHSMLWSLSKDTPENAGRGRYPGKLGEPVAIRDIHQVPDSLKEEAYGVYPGDILEGEAPDEVAKKLFEAWTAAPKHGEHVRWINRDFVRPLEPQSAGAALRFINGINNGFRFGRYLNPGYLRWLPQNLVLNLTQQGPFLFRNAKQMFTELHNLDPAVYHQIAESVSFGSARALESEGAAAKAGALQHKIANAWAHINDHVPRMLSWIHEAQRAGFKGAKDWEALMTDPRLKSQRDAVIMRANKEPIDYGAMTPRERVLMKSLFAYWPWIRAASLWALRFPFEHPYQMAAALEEGREGKKRVEDFYASKGGIAPPYLEGDYPSKKGPVDTSAINPWSQLAEDAQAFAGLTPSHPELAGAALGTISPAAKPVVELLTGHDQNGNIPKKGVLEDAANSMARTFEPFSIFRTATDTQTGATPKGLSTAIEKWLGSPQVRGYDYGKGAKNALKDVNNETRARFLIDHDPNAKTVSIGERRLVVRVAQIKDQTKSKSPQQIRALELADAAYNGTSLAELNSLLTQNKIRPVSNGDLIAERARLRAINP